MNACFVYQPYTKRCMCVTMHSSSFQHLSGMPNLTLIFACLKKHLFANVCLKNAPTYYRVHNHAFTWLPVCPIMHLLANLCPTMHLGAFVFNHAPSCLYVSNHAPSCL